MIYFRSHVQALDEKHAALVQALDAKHSAQVRSLDEKHGAHVQALESQIAYLKERLAAIEEEKRELAQAARVREESLLDRLLAKNNVAPIAEPPKSSTLPPDVLTPFGVTDSETAEAYKESWLREETGWIMSQLACDESTARDYAEQNYLANHQVIKGS